LAIIDYHPVVGTTRNIAGDGKLTTYSDTYDNMLQSKGYQAFIEKTLLVIWPPLPSTTDII
jgi:hypothetical protein